MAIFVIRIIPPLLFKMKFIKIITILAIAVLSSCKNDNSALAENRSSDIKVKDTTLRILPYPGKMPTVSSSYIANKKSHVANFYEKNWDHNTMNGGFLVAKNGQVIFEKYQGISDKSKKSEITSNTPLHIASVSKVLTATAILKLVDQKKLTLDQKVTTLLPTFPYPDVTIRTLLNHRSGLPNYAYFTDQKEIWDRTKILTNQDILDLLAKHKFPLYFKTDKKFGYCNTNFAMLALIIEKKTKMNYRDAMQKIIFEPLGMKNTFVFDYMYDKGKTSQSYKGNMVQFDFDYLDNIYGDKNIYSTPRDLLKFDMATYSPHFLNPDLLKEVFKGYSYEHKGNKNYGLGIRITEWETGERMFYHNGWWHGNTASYVKLKNDTVAIIAISNKFTYKTYRTWKLAPLFGVYPVKLDKDETEY